MLQKLLQLGVTVSNVDFLCLLCYNDSMYTVEMPAPEALGFVDQQRFDTVCRTYESAFATGTDEYVRFERLMCPVTEALMEQYSFAHLRTGFVIASDADPGEFFTPRGVDPTITNVRTWHTDRADKYSLDVLIADTQGTEFVSGTLGIPTPMGSYHIRQGLVRDALSRENIASTLANHATELTFEQAMPYAALTIGSDHFHRTPINGAAQRVARNLLIATYQIQPEFRQ